MKTVGKDKPFPGLGNRGLLNQLDPDFSTEHAASCHPLEV